MRRPGAAHTRVRGVDRGATHTRGSRWTSNESAALPSSLADVQAVGTLSYDVFCGCWVRRQTGLPTRTNNDFLIRFRPPVCSLSPVSPSALLTPITQF